MDKPEVIKSKDTFGILFHLGEEGACIIPLEFQNGQYHRQRGSICRVNQSHSYSTKIHLVNYVIVDNTIYTDPLSTGKVKDYGAIESDELFFKAVEEPAVLSKIVTKLHGEYKATIH